MKRKIVWSLTAMLAGTGFAAAQDNLQLASTRMVSDGAYTQQVVQDNCCDGYGYSSFGNNFRIWGRAEALVWQLGSSFRDSGLENLPSYRETMPYGFRSASYNITNPLTPVLFETKDIVGVAHLSPSILTGSGLDGLDRVGARITLGAFLDDNHDWSFEASFFELERKGSHYRGTASANNIQFTTGLNDIEIQTIVSGDPPLPVNVVVETPVVFSADFASAVVGTASSKLFGMEANVNHRSFTVGRTTISEIYGLRYLDLAIDQTLAQWIAVTDDRYIIDAFSNQPTTSTTALFGAYQAYNQFYAAQVGARFDSDYGRFFMNGFGKFAFGAMRQDLAALESVASTDVSIPYEVYPNPTIYRESRTRLAFALEGNLSAGFRVTDNCSIYAGYNILVMTRVAQLGGSGSPTNGAGSIDLGTAENPIPVKAIFREDRYYAHGATLGLEFRY